MAILMAAKYLPNLINVNSTIVSAIRQITSTATINPGGVFGQEAQMFPPDRKYPGAQLPQRSPTT